MYDYLIVGTGLYGATLAHELNQYGKSCLVIDRRNHIAGNAYTELVSGIRVHRYGAHIFHTSHRDIWDYVTRFVPFRNFINSPLAVYADEVYNLPFNMNTFSRMWGIRTPDQAKSIIAGQVSRLGIHEPNNLEEQALLLAGSDIYEKLIKGYTEKQWGRSCRELPPFLIRRIPFRFTYDNNYFRDPFQGIPEGGYTAMVEKMLEGIDVRLNTDYSDFIRANPAIAKNTIYTGCIDEYFGYRLGPLKYRSLRFETTQLTTDNFQGNAVVNFTGHEVPYTRIIEHKHFEAGNQPHTVISYEYPVEWTPGMEPYYPVNDAANNALYAAYAALAKSEAHLFFGGRLGHYRYYDMDQAIRAALKDLEHIL